MEIIKKMVQEKKYTEAVAFSQGQLRAVYQTMLNDSNTKENRNLVRESIKHLKINLEREYGQTLFDEEADNKLNKGVIDYVLEKERRS